MLFETENVRRPRLLLQTQHNILWKHIIEPLEKEKINLDEKKTRFLTIDK